MSAKKKVIRKRIQSDVQTHLRSVRSKFIKSFSESDADGRAS